MVLDNLNIHTPAALYETFPAEEARHILMKLEFHATPKHGSWLNMVEIELSVLSKQCLDQRLPKADMVKQETQAWERERNERKATVKWQFTGFLWRTLSISSIDTTCRLERNFCNNPLLR